LGGLEVKDLLLDTHVWIWLSIEDKKSLSKTAKREIQRANRKWISAISCWELAKLAEKGRIAFSIPLITWIRRSLNELRIEVAELSPEVAVESTLLNNFHKDPADQIIVATSRVFGIPLLTSDRRILDYPGLDALW
jgi:PIN domain nuclease of toxin-antitoxin system